MIKDRLWFSLLCQLPLVGSSWLLLQDSPYVSADSRYTTELLWDITHLPHVYMSSRICTQMGFSFFQKRHDQIVTLTSSWTSCSDFILLDPWLPPVHQTQSQENMLASLSVNRSSYSFSCGNNCSLCSLLNYYGPISLAVKLEKPQMEDKGHLL